MGEMALISISAVTSRSEIFAEIDVRILALSPEGALAGQRKSFAGFLGIHCLYDCSEKTSIRLK
jgi:hypothetical protein